MRFWRRPSNSATRNTNYNNYGTSLSDGLGVVCCGIFAFIIIELVFFLFQYFDVYSDVYPGSRVAQNLSGGKGTAFEFFKWAICWLSGVLTVPAGIYLAVYGVGLVGKLNVCLATLIAVPWTGLCLFLGSWQMWIFWMMLPLWSNAVWNNACNGWDGYAILQGISWSDVSSSLPYAGTATVLFAAGNYTLQLERNNQFHHIFYFYDLEMGNLSPTFNNITYNMINHTYTIENTTTHYNVNPNLAFPSLDLVLDDDSIPFGSGCDMPLADLVYRNGTTTSNVLNVVNINNDDCTQMKLCAMQNPQGDYQIAMGVVMIQQFLYGICCTTPDGDSSSSSGVSFSFSIG